MKKFLLLLVAFVTLVACHKSDKENQLFIYGYDKAEKQGNKDAYYTEQRSVKELFSETEQLYIYYINGGSASISKERWSKGEVPEIETYFDADEERLVFAQGNFDYGHAWDESFWLKSPFVFFVSTIRCDTINSFGFPYTEWIQKDTIGYIPFSERNSVYERVREIVEREGEITDECYDIWNATMHFYPITGAEYRAKMARGEY